MREHDEILKTLQTRYADPQWLNQNGTTLYYAIRVRRFRGSVHVGQGVYELLLVLPYMLNRDDLRRWMKLVRRAQKKLFEQRPDLVVPSPAGYEFTETAHLRERQRTGRSERIGRFELFEGYLKLLTATIWGHNKDDALALVEGMLAFARVVNNQYDYGTAYRIAAFVCQQHDMSESAEAFHCLADHAPMLSGER